MRGAAAKKAAALPPVERAMRAVPRGAQEPPGGPEPATRAAPVAQPGLGAPATRAVPPGEPHLLEEPATRAVPKAPREPALAKRAVPPNPASPEQAQLEQALPEPEPLLGQPEPLLGQEPPHQVPAQAPPPLLRLLPLRLHGPLEAA